VENYNSVVDVGVGALSKSVSVVTSLRKETQMLDLVVSTIKQGICLPFAIKAQGSRKQQRFGLPVAQYCLLQSLVKEALAGA
jgi:hypothetical protein